MNAASLINLVYIVAAILFIYGIKMLGSASTARRGNMLSSVGMLLAVVVTLIDKELVPSISLIVGGLVVGAAIGGIAAKVVKMTAMPEMVALFNGFGGLASLLVGWAEYERIIHPSMGWDRYLAESGSNPFFSGAVISLAILIGGITFTGSLLAYAKLAGRIGGSAKVFPGQKQINALLALATVIAAVVFTVGYGDYYVAHRLVVAIIVFSLALGVLGVLPIGGGDMPVVISLLNSFSGLAASAAGFVIANNVLVVAGCLVGASGFVLTVIMCKAMNRSLGNVLFSGFGAAAGGTAQEIEGEMKGISVEDAYYALEAARNVVIVPGYGMAVAQAQHVVKELGNLLEENGAEVRYAIHPVAGRMPGHMNVLLAEADVEYEQLWESEKVNPQMSMVDVAIVIGANDVVNPAAANDSSSPIYGMPIVNVHEARTVFALKRGKGAGFSGLVNQLYFLEKTRMIYGDAKATVGAMVAEFKESKG